MKRLDGRGGSQQAKHQVESVNQRDRLDKAAVEYLKSIAEFWEMGKPYAHAARGVWKRLREMMDEDDIE